MEKCSHVNLTSEGRRKVRWSLSLVELGNVASIFTSATKEFFLGKTLNLLDESSSDKENDYSNQNVKRIYTARKNSKTKDTLIKRSIGRWSESV